MKTNLPSNKRGLTGSIINKSFYQEQKITPVRKSLVGLKKIPTQKQWIMRKRFADAILFAKKIIADPALKALYTKMANKRCSAYSMAVSEYMVTGNNGMWVL